MHKNQFSDVNEVGQDSREHILLKTTIPASSIFEEITAP
jgi:hypothetical protein